MNATKSRTKPQRSIGIVATVGVWFLLQITVAKSKNKPQVDAYLCREIDADFGTAYRLEKQDLDNLANEAPVEIYHVNLNGIDGHHTCDCRGHGRHGHCKHSEGLAALITAGKLKPSKRADDAAEREAIEAEYDSPEDEWARIEAACS